MGDHLTNQKAVLHINEPRTKFPLRPCLIGNWIIRPGIQIVLEAKNHRKDADGGDEVFNDKGIWIPLGGSIKAWVVETQGPPPEDMWVFGVQVGGQMSETNARGETIRDVTGGTGQLLGHIEVEMARALEKHMLYGPGQGAALGLVKP